MLKLNVAKLTDKVIEIFMKAGVNRKEAEIFADMLVQADQRGVHTHGIVCVSRYVNLIKKGRMKANMEYKVERDRGAMAVWNGEGSSGQILGYYGMKEAMKKAKEFGIGAVAIKHANHFGAAAYYAQMANREGMIGIAVATGDPTMCPWGGAEKEIGNNPVAIAVPAGDEVSPVLDMAQSVVANGKVTNLRMQGVKTIPEGWALDNEGQPTTDMDKFYSVTPMAGYKGWGTAVMVDVLAGILFGGGCGWDAKDDKEGPGLLMMAFNIEDFRNLEDFLGAMDHRIRQYKGVKLAKNSKGIFMPGEIEDIKFRASQEEVDIIDEILEKMNATADELGVERISAEK